MYLKKAKNTSMGIVSKIIIKVIAILVLCYVCNNLSIEDFFESILLVKRHKIKKAMTRINILGTGWKLIKKVEVMWSSIFVTHS